MKRSIVWAIGFTLASIGLGAACGGTVDDTSGSAGKGGSGGVVPGTGGSGGVAPGTGGSGGVIGTGGSGGGSGGGDACTKACNHAEGCGENICSQLPIDCSTSQGMCLAACVNGASCQDIGDAANWIGAMTGPPPALIICAAPCLQGGTGGGGGSGGGTMNGCQTCAGTNCGTAVGNCFADQSNKGCRDWLTCAQGCNFQKACTDGCDASHPDATALIDPVYACACAKCSDAADCGSVDPCHHGGGSGGSMVPGN